MAIDVGLDATDSDARCEYTRHRDEIPTGSRLDTQGESEAELEFDADGYWRCGHACVEGRDQCVFHLPLSERPADIEPAEYVHRLIEATGHGSRRERRRRRQLIGATFTELDLSDERLAGGDNFPLDLRCAEIDRLDCENARIRMPVDLRGSDIEQVQAVYSEWAALHAQHATFGELLFDRARIEDAYLEHIEADRVRFYFAELPYVNFHYSEIEWLNLMYADLDEAGFFHLQTEICTLYAASFSGGYFNGFEAVYLHAGNVSAQRLIFSGSDIRAASFDGVTAGSISLSRVDSERVRLVGAEIDEVRCGDAALGIATFDGLECETLRMEETTFASLSLEDGTIEERVALRPETVTTDDVGYVSLRETELSGGELAQPDDGRIIYDLETTTLGAITTSGDDGLLDCLRIHNTGFEGFDFRLQEDIDLEAAGYTIHELRPGDPERIAVARDLQSTVPELYPVIDDPDDNALDAGELENRVDFESVDHPPTDARETARERAEQAPDPDETDRRLATATALRPDPKLLESTYLKAKNGATAVGHTSAAGRFFEKERKYRRHTHRDRFLGRRGSGDAGTRLKFGTQWLKSTLLSVTTGYGERPWRTVGSSFGTIALFAVIYTGLRPSMDGISDPGVPDYLLFSIQSFVALIVGAPPETSSIWIRIGSATEGFLGAFFIALFVFTLTRTVHR
jgi:uncharacterized protein YjbI with pentapeptide repeats